MSVRKLISELRLFAKNPRPDLSDSQISMKPTKLFFALFGINLLIGLFILSILSGIVRIIFHINFRPIDVPMNQLLITNIVFVPVFEEIAFRLPLKFKRWNISLSLFVISFIISSYFFGIAPADINNYLIQRLLISFFVFIFIFIFISINKMYEKINDKIKKNYKLFFYTFLLLFTLRHIDNYYLDLITILFLPVLLAPQFVGGFINSYNRLKNNFVSAIIFHFLNNLIAFLPQLVLLVYGN